jgi:hypothetical protein
LNNGISPRIIAVIKNNERKNMSGSLHNLFFLLVCLLLCSPDYFAQAENMPLKNLDKVLFDIYWKGNVEPASIGINRDSTFESIAGILGIGKKSLKVIDAREITDNPEHAPALIINIDLLTAGKDYLFYLVNMELVEYAPVARIKNQQFKVITWQKIGYDLYLNNVGVGSKINEILKGYALAFMESYMKVNSSE